MSRLKKHLLVTVEQNGDCTHYRMRPGDKLLIGRHPDCDVTVYGDQFPEKHALLVGKGDRFILKLDASMRGEVSAGDAVLKLQHLIAHGLLPQQGKGFVYEISAGRKGYVRVADATVTFQLLESRPADLVNPDLIGFRGFSWFAVTFNHLTSNLSFKVILLILMAANFFVIDYLKGIPTQHLSNSNRVAVPDRLVKIIMRKQPERAAIKQVAAVSQGGESDDEQSSEASEQAEPGADNVRPENQGLLGLLTGMGSSNQSGALADFLLDKGLMEELDAVMNNSDLKVGKGTSEGAAEDVLLATSGLGEGIEDVLQDIGEVETVSLGRRGQLKFDKISEMTGSEEALGRRSEASVQAVIQKNRGRLLYIYKKYLKHNPDFYGKLVLEIVIEASGRVASIQVVESSMQEIPEFQREILSFIRRWRFPRIEYGSVTVNFPLFFNKIG